MQFHVRRAVPADHEAITEVAFAAWIESYAPIFGLEYVEKNVAETYTLSRSLADITHKDGCYLVAIADGVVVGFSWIIVRWRETELMRLYVTPHWQGQKVGTALLEAGEQFLRKNGISHYIVHVHSRARDAVNFYKRRGFALRHMLRLGENLCFEKWLTDDE